MSHVALIARVNTTPVYNVRLIDCDHIVHDTIKSWLYLHAEADPDRSIL